MTLKVDGTNGVLQAYDYQVLTTGFTYTFAAGTQTLIANPAGTLATGTVTMPASPVDGMVITITSTQPITALTVNANTGQTINNGGAKGLDAGCSLAYVYNLANTKWQPFAAGLPIGVGQAWADVTASRTVGTTYTNTTGRPIQVNAWGDGNAFQDRNIQMVVNGVLVDASMCSEGSSGGGIGNVSAIVPAGATYTVSFNIGGVLYYWMELR